MMMRSEPVAPVENRGAPRREAPARAADEASTDAFEAALRRRGRQGLGAADDEAPPFEPPRAPEAPQPLQVAGTPPLLSRVEPPPAAPSAQPVAAPDVLTRQLQARALPEPAGSEGRWQLQIHEGGLPLQRVELQRSAAGPLTVLVSASADAQQPRHATRLRERLQARGAAQVEFRGPGTEQEPTP